MPNYAVSFKIASETVGAFTYNERYKSLMEQVDKDLLAWDETTSFALVDTGESLSDFADRLYFRSDIFSSTDILLVIDHAKSAAIGRGPIVRQTALTQRFKTFEMR
jgi:hypothetical protein